MVLPSPATTASSPTLLEMRQVSKSFPGVKALDSVDFTLRAGEIHALMGENGAGKSTLIKVLTGVYPRDSGTAFLAGQPIDPRSPMEAQALGISTVYQEVNLIPALSVAENIYLGRQPGSCGFVRWRSMNQRARIAIQRLNLDIDVTRSLDSYSIAIQQMVAIARALDVDAKVLILDEPTSSLDTGEVRQLFALMRQLKERGLGIAFVTHFMDQVYQISDRITVLRNGRLVGEFAAAGLPRLHLIAHMMGKQVADVEALSAAHAPVPTQSDRRVLLSARQLGRTGAIEPLDLDVSESEVVGLAGLLGSGRTETARLLFGVDRADHGHIEMQGRRVPIRHPRQAIALGLGFCPEDRKLSGIIPNLSVRENIILVLQTQRGIFRRISRREQNALAAQYIKALNIATSDAEKPIRFLSGGNQQKAILARWLASKPKLLILDEPTRGIDVGAKFEIARVIEELRQQGMALVFISSELEEVVRSCQRVVVLRDRRKITELVAPNIDEKTIMAAIAQAHEAPA